MSNPRAELRSPVQQIAQLILNGFDDYRFRFRQITEDAQERFEQARWQAAQQASADRIDLYEIKVAQVVASLHAQVAPCYLQDVNHWPLVKSAYIAAIEHRLDDELAETWFNSIYCHIFGHDGIADAGMFVHSTRCQPRRVSRINLTRRYHPLSRQHGLDLPGMMGRILQDYAFDVPYEDLNRDLAYIVHYLHTQLPDHLFYNPHICIELLESVFYRNKGAYLVGRLMTDTEVFPFVLPLLHREDGGIYVDTLITEEDEVSIIFSFTRSYFMVDVPVPAEFVAFLHELMPGKRLAELYASIGFYKHGKTEFYRDLLNHLAHTQDRFIMAPGIRGMVMSVITLPGFNVVFKMIKDHFAPPKEVNKETVEEKYRLVKRHDRVGRMADTQEFSNFRFPVEKFEPECLRELLEVAPSCVSVVEDFVIIRHVWTERRMTPLNLYLDSADEEESRAVINDYGNAIKQMAAANIFPGDMLLKNFGVTRHGRVVFYDYDEISYLTDMNFRKIPPPRFPEDEMASEPWYSVGPHDVFPEEFPVFLFSDIAMRQLFTELHGNLFDAEYWQVMQSRLSQGQVLDVYPYRRKRRFDEMSKIA